MNRRSLDVNQAGASVADRAHKPGELMRLVADGLTGSGLRVRLPKWEHGRRLAISHRGARCDLAVNDCGYVEWDYSPRASGEADPKQTADLATTLLTGRAGDYPRLGKGYDLPDITFKGIVGLELKARGLDVDLEVYEDEDYYAAVAEIVVTNPESEEIARVRATDSGSVTWEHDYWPEAAVITWEPDYSGWIADPGKVADAIVATIARAISLASPVSG
jgi:hypothetical protein